VIDTRKHVGLQPLPGFAFPALASAGLEGRARPIAERCVRAHRFLSGVFDFEPEFALLVLSPADWPGRSIASLYGIPNAKAGNLVIAGERSELAQGLAGLVSEARPDLLPELQAVYGEPNGTLDISPFFELLAVHELAHEFHGQFSFQFPRLWLMELFVNICMMAYLYEVEPEQVPLVETLARALAGLPPGMLAHTSLFDFEQLYTDVGEAEFGWYQCRLILAAGRIHRAGGRAELRRLWDTFALDDVQLAGRLRDAHPTLAEVLEDWH
jgi:hypothetical protein